MRLMIESERGGWLIRLFGKSGEVAYVLFALRGLCAEIEFPSDWHEQSRAWVRLGFGFMRVAFSFPWPWVVPDEHQCSGPIYGFVFFSDGLHLHWGKCKGKRGDPMTVIGMPWRWRHREHKVLSEPEAAPFRYVLRSGQVQERVATIQVESRLWTRFWLPFRRMSRYIDIKFDGEVGERSGTWKGGVIGCSYEMQPGEAPVDTLRRMERDEVFS